MSNVDFGAAALSKGATTKTVPPILLLSEDGESETDTIIGCGSELDDEIFASPRGSTYELARGIRNMARGSGYSIPRPARSSPTPISNQPPILDRDLDERILHAISELVNEDESGAVTVDLRRTYVRDLHQI